MTTTVPLGRRGDFEINIALQSAIRAITSQVMRGRSPITFLPGVLRSHLAITPTRCRCGYEGEWVEHMAGALDSAGMVARAF